MAAAADCAQIHQKDVRKQCRGTLLFRPLHMRRHRWRHDDHTQQGTRTAWNESNRAVLYRDAGVVRMPAVHVHRHRRAGKGEDCGCGKDYREDCQGCRRAQECSGHSRKGSDTKAILICNRTILQPPDDNRQAVPSRRRLHRMRNMRGGMPHGRHRRRKREKTGMAARRKLHVLSGMLPPLSGTRHQLWQADGKERTILFQE